MLQPAPSTNNASMPAAVSNRSSPATHCLLSSAPFLRIHPGADVLRSWLLIAVPLVMLCGGCAPMQNRAFRVVDAQTNAPIAEVETYCMHPTWQFSSFLGLPTRRYLPVKVDRYTDSSGMAWIPDVWFSDRLMFEKQGYESVWI